MHYRKAREADFAVVFTLLMQDDVIPFMAFEHMQPIEFKPLYIQFLRQSDCYVYQTGEQAVVGFCRLVRGQDSAAHLVEICTLAIHAEHRKKGYGGGFITAMIEHIKRDSAYQAIKRIEIQVDADNPGAARLYRRLGFACDLTFDDILLRATGTHKHKWYVATSLMSMPVGVPVCGNRFPGDSTPGTNTLLADASLDVQLQRAGNQLRVKVHAGDTCVLQYRCHQLGLRLANMGVVSDIQPSCRYTLKVLAQALQHSLLHCHRQGIRHLHIRVPQHHTHCQALLRAAGFVRKGVLLHAIQLSASGALANAVVFEHRLFNYFEILEYFRKSTFYKNNTQTPALRAALTALHQASPSVHFATWNAIYAAVDALTPKPYYAAGITEARADGEAFQCAMADCFASSQSHVGLLQAINQQLAAMLSSTTPRLAMPQGHPPVTRPVSRALLPS